MRHNAQLDSPVLFVKHKNPMVQH